MTQNWGDGGYQPFGGMPMAPAEATRQVIIRPGVAVSAAVLAFVQSGFTGIATLVMIGVAVSRTGTQATIAQGLWILQAIAVVALIVGGVLLLLGKNRVVLTAGNALHLVLSLLWVVVAARVPGADIDPVEPEGAKGALVLIAVVFAVLPIISLIQAGLQSTGTWLRAEQGRY